MTEPAIDMRRIAEFNLILGQAIHDVEHEIIGRAKVVHFWDFDSLYLPVRGADALDTIERQQDSDTLVQSLLSAGFLGGVSMLRPHRTELVGQIHHFRQLRHTNHNVNLEAIENRHEVVRVLDIAKELGESSQDGEPFADSAIAVALGELRQLSDRSFVYVEALAGTWDARLRRLLALRHLDLQPFGPSLGALSETPEFAHLVSVLQNVRKNASPAAIAIDAAALTSLIRLTQAANEGGTLYPRFFTSSSSLQFLYRSYPWLQSRLSFRSSEGGDEMGTVWRSGRYYLLRAIFPCLSLNSGRHGEPALSRMNTGPSVASLQDLHATLSAALESNNAEAQKEVLGEQLVGSSRVSDLVTDLWRSRMAPIWLALSQTSLPESFMAELASLAALGKDRRAHSAARQYESDVSSRLEFELDDYRLAVQLAQYLRRTTLQTMLWRDKESLSLTRDLGSVRWGIEYDAHDDRDNVWLDKQLRSNPAGATLRGVDLEWLRDSAEDASRIVAILFGFENFDLASDLLHQLEANGSSINGDPVLELMRLVAQTRSTRSHSERELVLLVDHLRASYDGLSAKLQSRLALGYAYAVFQAWCRSNRGGAWGLSELVNSRELSEWPEWSNRIVSEQALVGSPLQQMYGVNHILYVSTYSGVRTPKFEQMLFDFESLAARLRNPFFLDTAGYALIRPLYDATVGDGQLPLDARQGLDRGEDYLQRAGVLVPNDEEIKAHISMARKVRRQLRL